MIELLQRKSKYGVSYRLETTYTGGARPLARKVRDLTRVLDTILEVKPTFILILIL